MFTIVPSKEISIIVPGLLFPLQINRHNELLALSQLNALESRVIHVVTLEIHFTFEIIWKGSAWDGRRGNGLLIASSFEGTVTAGLWMHLCLAMIGTFSAADTK